MSRRIKLFPEDDIVLTGRCEIFPIEIFQLDEKFPTGRKFSNGKDFLQSDFPGES